MTFKTDVTEGLKVTENHPKTRRSLGAGFLAFFCELSCDISFEGRGPRLIWGIAQPFLNRSGWFLAQKIQKNHGYKLTTTETQKIRRLPMPFPTHNPTYLSYRLGFTKYFILVNPKVHS
jgi:hypothetical protein